MEFLLDSCILYIHILLTLTQSYCPVLPYKLLYSHMSIDTEIKRKEKEKKYKY